MTINVVDVAGNLALTQDAMQNFASKGAGPDTMDRLSLATLAPLPKDVARPAYDPAGVGVGIVHLGIGAFHRAHQAMYTDDAIARAGGDWGICGVSLRSPDVRDRMLRQDCLYTAVEKSPQGVRRRVVGSVRDVRFLGDERERVLQRLAARETRIVSLTVTEKGYCHEPATGRLDFRHPDIVHDLEHPEAPRSVPGLLVATLAARRRLHGAPLTVVCCDNLPQNGALVCGLVVSFAHLREPSLADWISREIAFPATMVDRIVPATTAQDIAANDAALGVDDAAPVVHEPFVQWVIEDRFVAGRPAWDVGGAVRIDEAATAERQPFGIRVPRISGGARVHLPGCGRTRFRCVDAALHGGRGVARARQAAGDRPCGVS